MFMKLAILSSVSGTMITLSSSNWLTAWSGSELALLGFIPLMPNTKFSSSKESASKYFMVQSSSSAFFLLLALTKWNSWSDLNNMLIFPLSLKIAAAPLHFWLPNLIENLSLPSMIILLTWQKLAPLFSFSWISSFLISKIAISSAILGSISLLNQSSIKKILVFSSISHLGWILISLIYSKWTAFLYLLIYSFNLMWVSLSIKLFKITTTSEIPTNIHSSSLLMALLSSGGFPPLIGFFPKILVLTLLIKSHYTLSMIFLLASSLLNLYIYLRSVFPKLLLHSISSSKTVQNSLMHKIMFVSSLILFLTLKSIF